MKNETGIPLWTLTANIRTGTAKTRRHDNHERSNDNDEKEH